MFGSTEIIVIALIIFVLFGAAAIPKFARSLGQAKSEFDKGLDKAPSSKEKEQNQEEEIHSIKNKS